MLGVGAVIAGAVPVALVAVDRSVAQGGGAELERAFAAVVEGPAGAVPTVAEHPLEHVVEQVGAATP